MIRRGDEVLFGRRMGAHGAGTFGWPGGGLEFGESLATAIRREAFEETGLSVDNPQLICVSNVIAYGRHYLDLEFQVDCPSGEPMLREPQYCEGWAWYPIHSPPRPLFRPCELGLQSLRHGRLLNDS